MSTARGLSVLGAFVGARGLQFLAPVATANLLTPADYGAVEFAHAAATVGVAVLALGMPAMTPFVLIQRDSRYSLRAILQHQVALSVFCAVSAVVALVAGAGNAAMAGLLGAALAVQILWTNILRSRGATSSSLFIEALPFTLVAAGALLARVTASNQALALVGLLLGAGTLAMLAGSVRALRDESGQALRYTATVRAGVPLMLGGLLTLLATSSGRLGMGMLTDNQMTGEFAAIARIAALPIVAHQLFIVAAFRNLYALPLPTLERLLFKVVLVVTLAVCLFMLALPWAHELFGPAFTQAARRHRLATALLLAQSILWSGAALNDLVASRHEVMGRILPFTGAALVAGLAVAGWQLGTVKVTVNAFAAWHTAVLALLFVAQSLAMAMEGVRFPRFWLVCLACYAAVAVPALLWAQS